MQFSSQQQLYDWLKPLLGELFANLAPTLWDKHFRSAESLAAASDAAFHAAGIPLWAWSFLRHTAQAGVAVAGMAASIERYAKVVGRLELVTDTTTQCIGTCILLSEIGLVGTAWDLLEGLEDPAMSSLSLSSCSSGSPSSSDCSGSTPSYRATFHGCTLTGLKVLRYDTDLNLCILRSSLESMPEESWPSTDAELYPTHPDEDLVFMSYAHLVGREGAVLCNTPAIQQGYVSHVEFGWAYGIYEHGDNSSGGAVFGLDGHLRGIHVRTASVDEIASFDQLLAKDIREDGLEVNMGVFIPAHKIQDLMEPEVPACPMIERANARRLNLARANKGVIREQEA